MFGESDSESPRVPSPWDSLTSASPTPPMGRDAIVQAIPRLTPEVEEVRGMPSFTYSSIFTINQGNVEYKLQLLTPSPARFARLVTQLKWRLLEGGGQAYYEIGVADSGALVGLPRQELEESLETLEAMAGEIGASVIIVKEIEVPPALSGLAQSQLERWEGRRRKRKVMSRAVHDVDSSSATSNTEPETEVSFADVTDLEDMLSASGSSPDFARIHCPSSAATPLDLPVAIFTMDADIAPTGEPEGATNGVLQETVVLSVNLEISAVYKPRPMRKRAKHATSPALTCFDKRDKHPTGKKGFQGKVVQSDHQVTAERAGDEDIHARTSTHSPKTDYRKQARERRRGSKNDGFRTHAPTSQHRVTNQYGGSVLTTNNANTLVSSFEGLHVTVDSLTCPPAVEPQTTAPVTPPLEGDDRSDTEVKGVHRSINEPRLIIEALVVRKMSLEDSFLDFGGFTLC